MTDFERGAKVAGSKFYFSVGEEAEREWKLIQTMLDFHRGNGYRFVLPPYLVNRQTAGFAGIIPRFEDDFYQTKEGLVLIPTAETPLVGLHADEIIPEADLPLKYVAFSPCFRKEAGTYGKRDKGLRRVHQFHKVELFIICKPEDSARLHEEMINQVTGLLDSLGVENRQRTLPAREAPPVSLKTVDLEIKHGEEWLEVSSISNTGENQSKPAKIRYRPKDGGKTKRTHLLNGSGVALPRLMLATEG